MVSSACFIIGAFLLSFLLIGTLELYFFSFASLFYKKKPEKKKNEKSFRLCIIIPAHNEEKHIKETVSLVKKCRGDFRVVVIADNCSDETAKIAKANGAAVLIRDDPLSPGKPKALQFAFQQLIDEVDAFLIVDAETKPSENLSEQVILAFQSGASAVQVGNHLLPIPDNAKNRLKRLAFFAYNTLRPMARSVLKLSCGVLGNGFAVSSTTLKKNPMKGCSLVEDAEYHLQLILNGEKVIFCPEASVFTETAQSETANRTQSSRWEGGKFSLMKHATPKLFKSVLDGNFHALEPFFDTLLLPLGWHVLFLLLAFFLVQDFLLFFALAPLCYVLSALFLLPAEKKDYLAIAYLPIYLVNKILFLPSLLKNLKNGSKWQRTERH